MRFGCFNNPAKLNDAVVGLWARILAAVPGSQLVLEYFDLYQVKSLRERITRSATSHGVDPGRIEFGGVFRSSDDHLRRYANIDIVLDPFPFTGSTATFEALWMGVPVVSLAGEAFMGRWTTSLLHKVGLPDLAVRSPAEYVARTIGLARDVERRTVLRRDLRATVARSVLCDARRTTRYFERALRAVWRRYCRDAT